MVRKVKEDQVIQSLRIPKSQNYMESIMKLLKKDNQMKVISQSITHPSRKI